MIVLSRSTAFDVPPATSLRDVTRNCDEDAPLRSGDSRWQDLSPARGDHAAEMLKRELEWRRADSFVHAALVSHRGAGKSTEILRMTDQLRDSYECVYLEATVEMDPLQIEAEDSLVNLAMAVEAHMRRIDKALPSELLQRVTNGSTRSLAPPNGPRTTTSRPRPARKARSRFPSWAACSDPSRLCLSAKANTAWR